MEDQVIEEIERLCGKVRILMGGWCHFVYRHLHYIYIPDKKSGVIRISIPYVEGSSGHTRDVLNATAGEANREMKFVKAIVLKNGCVSLNYDHQTNSSENVGETVSHIILTLFAASEYMKRKLQEK